MANVDNVYLGVNGQAVDLYSAKKMYVGFNNKAVEIPLGQSKFDYKTWLASASLSATGYANLDAVLADEVAVRKLMTIHAAVDYLAGWKTTDEDIVKILSNDICAKWITLRDYALDTLDREYRSLMESLGKYYYGEWALMPQVPTMTSDTASSGQVIYSTQDPGQAPKFYAWKAFDGDTSTYWYSFWEQSPVGQYIGYKFVNPTVINSVVFDTSNLSSANYTPKTMKVQASNDNSAWTDLKTISDMPKELKRTVIDLSNNTAYLYYRCYFVESWDTRQIGVSTLQFNAWAPKGNVPIMTSNTAPYGVASAYQVFDGNNATTASGTDFSYKFVNPVCVKDFVVKDGSGNAITGGTLQASNDGSTWVTPVADTFYMAWNVHFGSSTTVGTVQFYGREMRVSVPVMTSNTAPYGTVSCNPSNPYYQPFKAFDNDPNTYWAYTSGQSSNWIQYKFNNPMIPKLIIVGADWGITSCKISKDGTNFIDLIPTTTEIKNTAIPVNTDGESYEYFRFTTPTGALRELNIFGFNYSEYDWDNNTPRHYLYDHGVELETITTSGTVTKGNAAITLQASNAQAITSINTSAYNLMRGEVGEHASGTNQLICGSGSANFLAASMPYNQSLGISSISGANSMGVKQTSTGVFDAAAWWLE